VPASDGFDRPQFGVEQTSHNEEGVAPMTIHITKPEVEALINQRLESGAFRDAEDVILQALQSSGPQAEGFEQQRQEAIERLRTFGKTHGLSIGGLSIRELREQERP
jgi:hypothetical protein